MMPMQGPPSVTTTPTGESQYTTSAKGGGWRVEDVSVSQADNGGFIVRCSHHRDSAGENDRQPSYKSETLAFKTIDEVVGYLQQTFGGGAAAAPAPSATPEPAPDDTETESVGRY